MFYKLTLGRKHKSINCCIEKFGNLFWIIKHESTVYFGKSIFSKLRTDASFDAQPQPHSSLKNVQLCGQCISITIPLGKSRLRFNRVRPMLILMHWPSPDFTVPHTRHFARQQHRIHACIMTVNGHVTLWAIKSLLECNSCSWIGSECQHM